MEVDFNSKLEDQRQDFNRKLDDMQRQFETERIKERNHYEAELQKRDVRIKELEDENVTLKKGTLKEKRRL